MALIHFIFRSIERVYLLFIWGIHRSPYYVDSEIEILGAGETN